MKTLLMIGYIILCFLFYAAGERMQKVNFKIMQTGQQVQQFKRLILRVNKELETRQQQLHPNTIKELEEFKNI